MRACPVGTVLTYPCECTSEYKPKKQGTINLFAYTKKGSRRIPYEGIFTVCENLSFTHEYSNKPGLVQACYILETDKSGHVTARFSPGNYIIGSPMKTVGVWKFNPQYFWLGQAEMVRVTALLEFPN
ncbi:hypothetical protein A2Y99_02665 [Candidatus Gottesmanbacteria bacterium RBG_13_37_7]|uniref:Uncharacterized protein n=1 Tax=Candidatus Gottesmanbacteria bacterium RBG_13_37_7 TaxID=1798369 RepID=A0A1F5YK96_9BACT|nr:MAG: hypothetical protein A2Y99_02665 [Candidatus Gottesmanbacteria bacterium RBG_13_37_7]